MAFYESDNTRLRNANDTFDVGCRPSSSLIIQPALASSSKSIPVSIPNPWHKYSTSSVATFPDDP